MQLLIVLFAWTTLVSVIILLLAIPAGITLAVPKRTRAAGVFVLLVPTATTAFGLLFGFALQQYCKGIANGAESLEASQRLLNRAFWAWPIGFAVGALSGAVLGTVACRRLLKRSSGG